MTSIVALRVPKWGLSMKEGTVVHWWKTETIPASPRR